MASTTLIEKIDIALRDAEPHAPTVTVPLGKETPESATEELTKAGYAFFITENPATIVISVDPPIKLEQPPQLAT